MERFNKIAVGRELKMIELKKKIERLEAQLTTGLDLKKNKKQ